MIRIELRVEMGYAIDAFGADFIFNVHAAHTQDQTVGQEQVFLSQSVPMHIDVEVATGNRYMRLHAQQGELTMSYSTTVDLNHYRADPLKVPEIPVQSLPLQAIGYLYPSRYCQSDRLAKVALKEFGHLNQGYTRVRAICQWVQQHVAFTSNTSNANTSAVDTLVERVGVCRDFAHLMIAMCRALNIPARFATGTDYGADPALGPPDFHAYVEAYLGNRWYIFDPSGTAIPMGLVRLGTGRDAADVAIATIFGGVQGRAPVIHAQALHDPANGFELPQHTTLALSTAM